MRPPARTPADGKFCMLLIEEDAAVANTVVAALKGAGQDVEWVADAHKGFARFKESDHHLVMLDLELTGETGQELCHEIREISAVPVIIITARTGDEDLLLGFKVGADEYLFKPLDPRHLVLRVVALLRRVYRYDRLPTETKKPAPLAKVPVSKPASPLPNPSAAALRAALEKSGLHDVSAHTTEGLPSGWGGCEACGYMGPEFKFRKENTLGATVTGCPACESNLVAFTID